MVRRKVLKGAAILPAGLCLLAGAAAAGAAPQTVAAKQGGTLKVNITNDIDYMDPALAYYQVSWQMLYETCVTPYTYPDASGTAGNKLTPEAATAMPTVTDSGKTYTFSIRSGFKFSPGGTGGGQAVTAHTFSFVIDRDLKMQSGFTPFLSVIVGADAVANGTSKHVSGVTVKGNQITIKLTKPTPDLPARLATRFMCAVPSNTPADPNGLNVIPGAGPYYVASRTPNRAVVLKRNPNWSDKVEKRPHNFNEIDYTVGVDLDQSLLQVKSGQSDYMADGLPPTQIASLSTDYGKSSSLGKAGKQQFFIYPEVETDYLGLNTSRPTFSNVNLRKAVNYAINRKVLEEQRGAFAGSLTDQILPPGMPGFSRLSLYPTAPDLAKAKQYAGNANVTAVMYTCTTGSCPNRAAAVQQELKQIGINVQIQQFSRATQFVKEGVKGAPFDIADEGWGQDYPDPSDFMNVLLDGNSIQDKNNNNFAYFDDPRYNKALEQAAELSGDARYSAYGKLDKDIMGNAAPWAPYDNRNDNQFFSARIGCQLYQPVYTTDLGALCLR
jgi:peptide/nickel transport system substrate-binding protein